MLIYHRTTIYHTTREKANTYSKFRGDCKADNSCAVVCGFNSVRCCTPDNTYAGLHSYAFGQSPFAAEGPHPDTPIPECAGIFDNSGWLCFAGGVCTKCGQVGKQCCEDARCDADRAQRDTTTDIWTQPKCGREGQPCCNVDPSEEDCELVCERQLGSFGGK